MIITGCGNFTGVKYQSFYIQKTETPVSLKAPTLKASTAWNKVTLRTLFRKQRITCKKVSGATGYMLYQRTANIRFRKIKILTSRSTTWSVRTKKGTLYSYKLVPYHKVNGKIKTGPASLIKKARAR